MIWALRHPFVEGEGKGTAQDTRDVHNELSLEGKKQVAHILNFLRQQNVADYPSVVIAPSEPRYQQLAKVIAEEFGVMVQIEERLCQVGERMAAGDERVKKFNDVHLPNMLDILSSAPENSVIVTSNPLLECLQYQARPITLKEMEEEGGKKRYRVNPGCGLEIAADGTVIRRLDLFDKEGAPQQVA